MRGAIAIDLAVRHPEAAGLVVQSSFTSMQKMVERYAHLQMFPVSLLLTQRFDSVSKVKSLRMPVLFIHGTADQYIPAAMSRKLYATTPQPKQLLLVKGVKHNNGAAEYGTTQHLQSIRRFVER